MIGLCKWIELADGGGLFSGAGRGGEGAGEGGDRRRAEAGAPPAGRDGGSSSGGATASFGPGGTLVDDASIDVLSESPAALEVSPINFQKHNHSLRYTLDDPTIRNETF